MAFLKASFEIVEEKDCPMYSMGDRFHLSGLAFSPPDQKATCLFLSKEVTEFMIRKLGEQQFSSRSDGRTVFNCSGCTGLIKFELKTKEEEQYATMHMRMLAKSEATSAESARKLDSLSSLLTSFSFFQVLDEKSLNELISHVTVKQYSVDQDIICQGDESCNVYMVLTGKVSVRAQDIVVAYLGRGDIFGEMSMLTGKPVGATIRVVEPAKILSISNEHFRLMMVKYPTLQLRISQILANRLNETNAMKGDDPQNSFSGVLEDFSTAELCQFLNNNSKTGTIQITSSLGEGNIIFSQGEIVQARYGSLTGVDAFQFFLKETEGAFSFLPGLSTEEMVLPPLGSFMNILMEGLQKIDEE